MRRRLDIRAKAALAALGLALALLALWGATGWAWPTPQMAFRALERSHAFGPGRIVAQGTTSADPDPGGTDSRFIVSRSGDVFGIAVLRPAYLLLWEEDDGLPIGFLLLRPTEDYPLPFYFLDTYRPWPSQGGSRQQMAVVCADPAAVRVELSMVWIPMEVPVGERAAWAEEHCATVTCSPAGEGVWTGTVDLTGSGGTSYVRPRAYDAQGRLLYDNGWPDD